MRRTWSAAVVVGASSGIGEAIARQLASEGTKVALVARRKAQLDRIVDDIKADGGADVTAFQGDVRDTDHSRALFGEIIESFGDFDLMVYASGIMPHPGADQSPTDADISAIETNFVGAVTWINEALTYLQGRRTGTIVGIGSVAGDRGRRGNPVYNATKSALATYLESLRGRVHGSGVQVITVKPGFVRTDMIGDRRVFPPAISPTAAATSIIEGARKGRRVIYVPGWWLPIAVIFRLVPGWLVERLPF